MNQTLTFALFSTLFFIAGVTSAVVLPTQTISLNTGWNIVSTPRVLDSHSFSASSTVNNFDIYILNPSDPSGWSTMAGMGHAEFQPLYGYFIKNKTGVDQTLTLNYKQDVNPNERLFERNLSQTGWYSIGPANPTYVKSKCSDASDINNVGNILYSLNGKFSNVIDFTDGSFLADPNSVKIDAQWKSVTPSDINSLRDLWELKGYGIYINQSGALLYNGFQNTDGVCASLISIAITTPATKLSYFVGDTLDITGLVVTGTYSDGAQQIEPITVANVTGFDSTAPVTDQVLTITVNGRTTTYTIDIVAAPIIAGTLSISVSTSSPAGSSAIVVRSITPQVLGVYDIRAVGEDVMVNVVNLTFSTGIGTQGAIAGTINNVGLYDEAGALLSNQVTLTADQTVAPDQWQSGGVGNFRNAFAMNWLIPANTTKKLYIKGTTNTITAPNPAAVLVQLDNVTTVNAVVATGMSSSGIQGANNIQPLNLNLALPALTINATATYLAVPDPTTSIYNQSVIAPAAQVTLGYLKVTAQNESQDLRQLEITNTAGVGNMNAILSGVAIFDGNTQVMVFNAPNNGTAACLSGGANVNKTCFVNADIITPTTFTLNTPKVLKVVGNVLAAATEVNRLTFQVTAGELQTIGKDSGALAVNAANINLVTNAGAYNETGTYAVRTDVVEVWKDAASPSGNVRGTFVNHGIWDFTLNGTANTIDVSSITFTSLPGLPNTASPITTAMFRLYDYTNSVSIATASAVDVVNGTVSFMGLPAAALRVTRGQVQKISLQVTTTNVAVWPINTSLQWSIRSFNDVSVSVGGVGYGGTTWSLPADTNAVTLP